MAGKNVFPKNKQHAKKRCSSKKLLATIALSITLSSCQNRQIRLRQANILWVFLCFLLCFLKNEHIATEGISCLTLFTAVRSRRYPICVKKDSVQTAWVEEPARRRCVLLGLPLRRATGGRRTRGTCYVGARVTKGPVHSKTCRKCGNYPRDPPELLAAAVTG